MTDVWEPIELASNGDRPLLVWCPKTQAIQLARWSEKSEAGADDPEATGCWVHVGTGDVLDEEPTLWMQPPPPPTHPLMKAMMERCDLQKTIRDSSSRMTIVEATIQKLRDDATARPFPSPGMDLSLPNDSN